MNCNLRELRQAKGLTQNQLAEMLNLEAYQTIQYYENGKLSPSLERAIKISRIVGTPVNDIWTGSVKLKRTEMKKPRKTKKGILQRLFGSPR